MLGEGTQRSVKCQKLKSESILMMSAGKADGKMGRWLLHYGVAGSGYTGTEAGEEGNPEDQLEGSSRSQESFEPISKLVYPRGSIDIICLRTASPHLNVLPVGLEED